MDFFYYNCWQWLKPQQNTLETKLLSYTERFEKSVGTKENKNRYWQLGRDIFHFYYCKFLMSSFKHYQISSTCKKHSLKLSFLYAERKGKMKLWQKCWYFDTIATSIAFWKIIITMCKEKGMFNYFTLALLPNKHKQS